MPPASPITLPAGYAPAFALGFADPAGALSLVAATHPLPVTFDSGTPIQVQTVNGATPPAPMAGSVAISTLIGPFQPVAGRTINLELSGVWSGTVQVERSTDIGVSRHPLTAGGLPWGSFTANACEAVWHEAETGVRIYLAVSLVSGTLGYRISQ